MQSSHDFGNRQTSSELFYCCGEISLRYPSLCSPSACLCRQTNLPQNCLNLVKAQARMKTIYMPWDDSEDCRISLEGVPSQNCHQDGQGQALLLFDDVGDAWKDGSGKSKRWEAMSSGSKVVWTISSYLEFSKLGNTLSSRGVGDDAGGDSVLVCRVAQPPLD